MSDTYTYSDHTSLSSMIRSSTNDTSATFTFTFSSALSAGRYGVLWVGPSASSVTDRYFSDTSGTGGAIKAQGWSTGKTFDVPVYGLSPGTKYYYRGMIKGTNATKVYCYPKSGSTGYGTFTTTGSSSYTYYAGVKYDLNKGSGTFNDQTDDDISSSSAGMTIKFQIRSGEPTKSGYLFAGWKDSNGNIHQPEGYFNVYTDGKTPSTRVYKTLTAQWLPIVYNDAGGGVSATAGETTATVTIKASSSADRTWRIWYSATNNLSSSIGWTSEPSNVSISTATANASQKGIPLSNLSSGTKYYYKTMYSTLTADSKGNVNIYCQPARGGSANTFTTLYRYYGVVKYDKNGGSGTYSNKNITGTSTASVGMHYNSNFTLPSTAPTKSGKVFAGWKSSSTNKVYSAGATIASGTDLWMKSSSSSSRTEITFTAQWEDPPTYTYYLYYDSNNVTCSGLPSTQSEGPTTDTSHKFTIPSTAPTASGYNFIGYNTSSSATTSLFDPGDPITLTSSSPTETLYAIWEEITYNYYSKITFDTNGGTGSYSDDNISGTSTSSVGMYYQSDYTLPSNVPTQTDKKFTGWKCSCNNLVYAAGATLPKGKVLWMDSKSSPITFTAQWGDTSKEYWAAVYYDGNGATSGTTASQLDRASSTTGSASVGFKVNSSGFTRTYYTFKEWNTKKDGTGTSYASGASISITSSKESSSNPESVTLYAQWTYNSFAWTYAKISGEKFNLTAVEWNNYCTRLKAKCAEYGYSKTFTTVSQYQQYLASHFNEVSDALYDLYNNTRVVNKVSSNDTIYASQMNDIVTYLNNK